MKKIIFLLILILQIFVISATGPVGENGIDVTIKNNTIEIKGYTIVAAPPYGVPTKFVSSNPLFINPVSESLGGSQACNIYNYTSGNETINTPVNCSYSINYFKELTFITNFTNQSVTTITDVTTQGKYDQCVLERAQYSISYSNCLSEKNKMESYEANFTNCKDQLNSCQNQIPTLQTQVTTMNKEKEDSKNTPWVYGVVGLAIGVFGTMFYTGRIGSQKARNPDGNYNRTQSG